MKLTIPSLRSMEPSEVLYVHVLINNFTPVNYDLNANFCMQFF